jgi:predicted RNase H-like HicB family nuclease
MSGISLGGFLRSIFDISSSLSLGFAKESGNGRERQPQKAAGKLARRRIVTPRRGCTGSFFLAIHLVGSAPFVLVSYEAPCVFTVLGASSGVTFTVETEQERDGRWIAEIPQIPGAMSYGKTRDEAVARVEALGLRVLAERIEQGESSPEISQVFTVAAA